MSFYDEIEIEDMTYHEATTLYTYPCPCGDQFEISLSDLRDGEEVAVCPSCSLTIKVIFEADNLPKGDGDGAMTAAPVEVVA
ncbi:diphthamide biosynthesis protein [Usnea florida]